MKYDVIFGIDPDVDNNGLARLDTREPHLLCTQSAIGELVDYLKGEHKKAAEVKNKMLVVVEGGWLNQSNWHLGGGYISPSKAAEIGRAAGRNHQRGIDIAELLDHHGIPYVVVKPLKKIWATRDGKISHDLLKDLLKWSGIDTNIKGRSNPEMRDAALLALEYSGLPLRVKPTGVARGGRHACK